MIDNTGHINPTQSPLGINFHYLYGAFFLIFLLHIWILPLQAQEADYRIEISQNSNNWAVITPNITTVNKPDNVQHNFLSIKNEPCRWAFPTDEGTPEEAYMKDKTAELPQQIMNLADLKEHPLNPNTHPDSQIQKLRHLIQTHGYYAISITIQKSTNTIIKGHGVREALIAEGYNKALVNIKDCDDAQALAILIADNKVASDSILDDILLQTDISELSDMNVPSLDFGYDGDDLSELAGRIAAGSGGSGKVVEDDFDPNAEVEPISKTGDLWILGKHRVLCGDSTKQEDVARLMDGQKADMVFTDPPYGIKRDKGFEGFEGFGGFGKPIARKRYENDDWDSDRPNKILFDNILLLADKILIFGGNFFADQLPQGKHWIVWDKLNTMPTFGDCELIWTNINRMSVKKITFEYNGLIGKEKERFHPTQKPVKLLGQILEDYSELDNIIVDLFLGSGTTLIACEQLDRICFGMEIDPHYTDVIAKRYIDFKQSNGDVFLERDGQKIAYSEMIAHEGNAEA